MADIVFILVVIGFFALCTALVIGCERIVRSGDDTSAPATSTEVLP